jgi:hypothetical protein
LEESGDIDYQLRLFKSDLEDREYDVKKSALEKDLQAKLRDLEVEKRKKLDDARDKVRLDVDARVDKERDKEMRKYKLETTKMNDRKDELMK